MLFIFYMYMATEGQFNSSKLDSILGLGVCCIYIIYICTCRADLVRLARKWTCVSVC